MKRLFPMLAALTLAVWTLAGLAEEPGRTIVGVNIGSPGDNAIPLALPDPKGGAPQSAEFWAVIKRDLELSGYFNIIGSAASIEPATAGLKPGEFQFSDWRTVGAAVLAKTGEVLDGGTLRTEVWVYDVGAGEKLGARAFTAPTTGNRSMAHRVANEIMFLATGHRGFFDTRFAFTGSFTGNKEIYVMDVDGYARRQITKNGSINLKPRWNPAGNALAFTSYFAGNPDLYIADMRAGKGQIRRISSRNGINTGGAFSPDGSKVVVTLTMGGDADLYLLDSATGNQISRLTTAPGIDTSATWSPDGSQLAFVSERGGGAQIYIMSAGGGEARRVTFAGSQNTDPSWSPKGAKIAFVSRDGNFDVFTTGIDGKGLNRITQGQGDNEDPSWSPDGDYLAFSSTRSGGSQIWIASADGRHQIQVTSGGGGYTNPHWSPHLSW